MAGRATPPEPSGLAGEAAQLTCLTRHFFGRLFRNETVDFEDQMKERLIATLSVLAIIVFWATELLLFKYHFVPDTNISWQEKLYLYALVMIIFGIVTLLEWDVLFPDRQDFLNLTPLPIRLRTLFLGKLASFVLFVSLFSAAMNCGAGVLFSVYLTPWRAEGNLLFAAWYVVSHLLASLAACFFVFFACIFLQFLLMAVLPRFLYRTAALLVRGALLAILIFFLLAFLIEPGILDRSFQSLTALKAVHDPFFLRFPPFWFVGLFETLLGTADPMFAAGARMALWAVVFSLAAFGAASGLSYVRHVRRTLEAERTRVPLSGLREKLSGLFRRLALRTPEERAVYPFFSKSLRTSPKHRSAMNAYLAIAAGVVLLFLISNRDGLRGLTPANRPLLAQPFVFALVVLVGLRSLVNIPVSPAANWVFEATETGRPARYAAAARKAVFFRWLVPLAVLVFAV
ncbi:MAG TPA: hypothetical protein VEG35_05280, partial [Burkholderiales bacterium]|nr:hypothetical protein [Burkholderiales bacterium]